MLNNRKGIAGSCESVLILRE